MKRKRKTKAKTEALEKCFIIEPIIMKLPGMIVSERAIKNQLTYISFSTGYLVNIPR